MLCVEGDEPGGTVDPGALLAGLVLAAHEAGAVVHEQTPVVRVELGEPVVVATGRRLAAGTVVVAANAWTPAFLPLPVDVAPALTLALCTAPLDAHALDALGLGDRRPFYTVDLPYLWGRTLADDRLMFGAGLVFPGERRVDDLALDDPPVAAALARLEARVRAFHPVLDAAGVTARWGGPVAFRRDGLRPIVARHPDAPHVIVTGAYAGHGVALAPRVGALVADAILRGRPLPAWGALARNERPTAGAR